MHIINVVKDDDTKTTGAVRKLRNSGYDFTMINHNRYDTTETKHDTESSSHVRHLETFNAMYY